MAGGFGYEQALEMIRTVVTSDTKEALEQQFRQAIFNIIGRSQDDHTKNIAYLMEWLGNWKLSPAYDMAYRYNPTGERTSKHRMSLNGKRDEFTMEDFYTIARLKIKTLLLLNGRDEDIVLSEKISLPSLWFIPTF